MSDPYPGNEAPGGPGGPTGPGGPGGPGGPSEEPGPPPPPPRPERPPFPWSRLFYAIGFSVVAWVVFWVILVVLAPLHYITLAITGHANDELKQMSLRAVHYLFELLTFITGARDEKPFPLGPFPKD